MIAQLRLLLFTKRLHYINQKAKVKYDLDYYLQKDSDNIAVSIFVVILVDFEKYWIWDEQACLKRLH